MTPKLWIKHISVSLLVGIVVLGAFGLVVYQQLPDPGVWKTGYAKVYWDKKQEARVIERVRERPYNWMSFKEISPALKKAVLLAEDDLFYQHDGFNFDQIEDAVEDTLNKGKRLRGASTISQQLVKNLYLSNDRSFWRKFLEAAITYKMEKALSKDRILELYLNIAHWGPRVYGIRGAAGLYFKKLPKLLNHKESAYLAMLLPSPERYSTSFRKEKKLSAYGERQVESILQKMKSVKFITEEQLVNYQNEELFNDPQSMSNQASSQDSAFDRHRFQDSGDPLIFQEDNIGSEIE